MRKQVPNELTLEEIDEVPFDSERYEVIGWETYPGYVLLIVKDRSQAGDRTSSKA